MKQDPFKEYIRQSEPDKQEKGYIWQTAIGLQAVDGLKPSNYLINTAIQNIEGKITLDETQQLLDSYYRENPKTDGEDIRTEEADKVSVRIAKLLSENAFSFTPNEYISIHKNYLQEFTNMPERSVTIILPRKNGFLTERPFFMGVLPNFAKHWNMILYRKKTIAIKDYH